MKHKRIAAWLLAGLMCLTATAGVAQTLPAALTFEAGEETVQALDEDHQVSTYVPVTAREDVNRELNELVEQMKREAMPPLRAGEKTQKIQRFTLKVNTSVSRTGTKWMSFLTTATINDALEQLYTAHDARAYDMETGARLTLKDVLRTDEASRAAVERALREGIEAYFPQETPNEAALAQTLENLYDLPFTLSAGALRFHLRADAFYPDKQTLLHVKLLYPAIQPCLTEEALQQTDNTGYKLIALTFDDGPARFNSLRAADLLKRYGADATFFLVGERLSTQHFALKYEHDSAFQLACHSFSHYTDFIGASLARQELARFDEALSEVVGTTAGVMRAPGGYEKPYLKAGVHLPLLNWSIGAGDGSSTRNYNPPDILAIINRVTANAEDGTVVLFHDVRDACPKYLEPVLQYLAQEDFLCVTVDELFSIRGIELQPNVTYFSAKAE